MWYEQAGVEGVSGGFGVNSPTRKYQVFVSSTFKDLIAERQAAVQAILQAGHIPAGMELFSAGSESQLETVCRWIDGSDIYLLILGGRYGTIEPSSGKSYTQLEYEYACSIGIPLFSVVQKESALEYKAKRLGTGVVELAERELFHDFKSLVLSKTSLFFDDEKDIQNAIFRSIREIEKDASLAGWVRADVTGNELIQENAKLRKALARVETDGEAPGKFADDSQMPSLPPFGDEVEVRVNSQSVPAGPRTTFRGSWQSLFPFLASTISCDARTTWEGEVEYLVDVGESRKAMCRDLLHSIQGYAVPGYAVNEYDYDRLWSYYVEFGLLDDGGGTKPLTSRGAKLMRRLRVRYTAGDDVQYVSGPYPITDEIPF